MFIVLGPVVTDLVVNGQVATVLITINFISEMFKAVQYEMVLLCPPVQRHL